MNQKVIIVKGLNIPPEDELNERIAELGEGWRVVSATTSIALHGEMDVDTQGSLFYGVARHAYYVTTAIVERG